jgi:uncharacterized membrane protein SpoIIM required for sporulation
VIIDLQRFITEEKQHWTALEAMLERLEDDPAHRLTLEQAKTFHYLYQRTSADLAKVTTFASDPETRRYLESLVARAYAEVHESREKPHRLSPIRWLFVTFPRAVRKHGRALLLSVAITVVGTAFGGLAVTFDPDARAVLMPFPNLQQSPTERVAEEEKAAEDRLKGVKMSGAAWYMTHNTQVSVFTMALGITWGVGTVIMLFYNGVILGAVALDYVLAGQSVFLLAWLSPHGVVEIPAILLAGQAGLVLGGALIGWGSRLTLRERLRRVSADLVTLVFGVALMLVWAGFVESFISQYHEPVLPYSFKIGLGIVEFILLVLLLARSGRKGEEQT